MSADTPKLQPDPAEGDRETIERQLKKEGTSDKTGETKESGEKEKGRDI